MSPKSEGMPFSVGAIGPVDLTGARRVLLRASIARVLRDVAEGLAPLMKLRAKTGTEVTRPRVVSSLNGDVDLLVVEEAVAAGYETCLVLPRPGEEQVSHLGPALETRARRALKAATSIQEPASLFGSMETGVGHTEMLGGQSDLRSRLLTAADLMICVWDGVPDTDPNSPGAITVAAAEQGIPVVWISSDPPHGARLHSLSGSNPESWNRILPPDVLERLERLAAPEAEDPSPT